MITKTNRPSSESRQSPLSPCRQQEMTQLYESCLRIREVSRQLLAVSEDMALIALNAEIAAAKSRLNQEAFMILASETGRIARQMSGSVSQTLAGAEGLARHALLGVVRARQLAKLNQGLQAIRQASNATLVEPVARDLGTAVVTFMDRIQGGQEAIEESRQSLGKHNQRVARIITYFRIEASRDAEHGAFFHHLAEDLSSLIALAQAVSHDLQEVLRGAVPVPVAAGTR